jgi:hypothetical protein
MALPTPNLPFTIHIADHEQITARAEAVESREASRWALDSVEASASAEVESV